MCQLRGASNIVHLLGWCNTTILWMLTIADGTLVDLLRNKKHEISAETSLKMALGIAKGVQQLHAIPMGPVTHYDIKPKLFLFTNQGTLLLNDLDLMRCTGHSNSDTKCNFHDRWSDSLQDEKYDIYETAKILWMLRKQKSHLRLDRKEEIQISSTGIDLMWSK